MERNDRQTRISAGTTGNCVQAKIFQSTDNLRGKLKQQTFTNLIN